MRGELRERDPNSDTLRRCISDRHREKRPVRTGRSPEGLGESGQRGERGARHLRGRGAHPAATGTGTVRQLRTLALALPLERRRSSRSQSRPRRIHTTGKICSAPRRGERTKLPLILSLANSIEIMTREITRRHVQRASPEPDDAGWIRSRASPAFPPTNASPCPRARAARRRSGSLRTTAAQSWRGGIQRPRRVSDP